jgi:F-type H+-transporting ATPase subunit b
MFLAKAKDEITFEKELAMKDLRKETVDLAVLIAEKILKQSVDEATRRRMLDEFIDELKNE